MRDTSTSMPRTVSTRRTRHSPIVGVEFDDAAGEPIELRDAAAEVGREPARLLRRGERVLSTARIKGISHMREGR